MHLLLEALWMLDYVHTGLTPNIHRDIKLDNIMLRHATGQVVLIEFGVVKEVTYTNGPTIADPTIAARTVGYMPAVMGNNPSHHEDDTVSVNRVSLEDVLQFIEILNQLECNGFFQYRLPTVKEREFAAWGSGLLNLEATA